MDALNTTQAIPKHHGPMLPSQPTSSLMLEMLDILLGRAELVSGYSLFSNHDDTCEILQCSHASYQILIAPQ